MKRFDLNARLDEYYRSWPNSGTSPVIGITANYAEQQARLADGYYKRLVEAGATPVVLPPLGSAEVIASVLDRIDGLLLSGGADLNPLYCGEQPDAHLGGINSERDLPELLIARLAANRQMPVLGICRGIQTLAVALGGHVCQHITTPVKHSQDADRSTPTHTIDVKSGTLLHQLYATSADKPLTLAVNSFHHQAVDEPGPHLRVSATAPDGIIEAVESSEHKPVLGVQWHPECMPDDGKPLFQWLQREALLYRKAQRLHNRVLTLDTHCDSPMLFAQGADITVRDPRLLVSLPKMMEGRLDATIMVCYLPQPGEGETFRQKIDFDVEGPKAYADLIFDKIEQKVSTAKMLSLAHTPDELLHNKRTGKKSIMLGIENGLALEGRVENVEYFAKRGVVYITLCHNGDNDLCDSAARSLSTHGGVSPLGEQVIKEMNRLGLMVDLSHAAESSFYDALEISAQPIVCSHSSARALCDHPRNLTDEQMRSLARKGGVCQVTLYHGFLRKDGKATILDAMQHLEHAIRVMGIDHVGLGTDFDGDGGVPGLADASELTLFTRQLLQRRYKESDIRKIWGGNFLRVMRQVQEGKKGRPVQ